MFIQPVGHRIGLVVLCLTAGAIGGQQRDLRRAKPPQDVTDAILHALRAPVPPVVIHDAIFNDRKAVHIVSMEAVDEDGEALDAPAELEALSPGVILTADLRAVPVDSGDPIRDGDILIKAVLANPGPTAVRLSFAWGWTRTVPAGERLYVGSAEGLLGPGGHGGAAAVIDPGGGGETHCPVCQCSCTYSGGSCTARIESSSDGGCGHLEGAACVCNTENGEKNGTLNGCSKVYVPCKTK